MKRLILSILLVIMAKVAYPQLGGRLGKVVDRGIEKVDIIQVDFKNLDAETAQLYIDGIRNYVNKKDMLKYSNNPQELEKDLEEIDGSDIVIWECYTTKGWKRLHKTISRLVPKTQFGMGWNLYLWNKSCGKYPRMLKSIGMYDENVILRYNHTAYSRNKLDWLDLAALDKSDNRLVVMCYIGTRLIYWSNKQ